MKKTLYLFILSLSFFLLPTASRAGVNAQSMWYYASEYGSPSSSLQEWEKEHVDIGTANEELQNPTLHYVSWSDLNITEQITNYYYQLYPLFDAAGVDFNNAFIHYSQNVSIPVPSGSSIVNDRFFRIDNYLASSSTYTDITAQAYGDYDTQEEVSLPVSYHEAFDVHTNDILYIGQTWPFAQINFNLSQGAGSGFSAVWEYWNGNEWTTLSTTDGTNGMKQSGQINFTAPSDWAKTNVNGDHLYFVRLRCETAGTSAPTTSSTLNDFSNSNEYLSQKGISGWTYPIVNGNYQIPGWNPLNPGSVNASATSEDQARVPAVYLGARWLMYPANTIFQNYIATQSSSQLQSSGVDGVFVDNTTSDGIMPDYDWGEDHYVEYPNGQLGHYSTDMAGAIGAIKTAVGTHMVIVNTGGPAFPPSALITPIDGFLMEQNVTYGTSLDDTDSFLTSQMNTIKSFNQAGKIMALEAQTGGFGSPLSGLSASVAAERFGMLALARYYLLGYNSPNVNFPNLDSGSYFELVNTSNYANPQTDFISAIQYNMGTPTGDFYLYQTVSSGTGPATSIYARNYTNGMVLYRPASADGSLTDAVSVPLPGNYQPLNYDGTLSASTNAVTMDAFEGMILTGSNGGIPLTVTTSGPGTITITSSPAGISCPSTCSSTFTSGTKVVLTATASSGSVFTGWSGGGCSGAGTCTVTMNSAVNVTATSNTVFTLAVSTEGSGFGTVTDNYSLDCGVDVNDPQCNETLNNGMADTLIATPATGSSLIGWSGGGCSGNSSTCALTISGATTISATFAPMTYAITASAGIGGTISPIGTTTVTYGGSQVYTVTTNTGYNVNQVLVDGAAVAFTNGQYTFTDITTSHTIAVSFALQTENLTVSAGSNGSISPSGTVIVAYGANQTFTVMPNIHYKESLTVDGTVVPVINNTYTLMDVTSNHRVVASFTPSSTSIYVSTSGNDSNLGTQASPFLTIQHALQSVKKPTTPITIMVENGTYSATTHALISVTNSGTAAAPITIEAQNLQGAILNGKNVEEDGVSFGPGVSYVNIQGFEMTGFTLAGVLISGRTASTGDQHITIRNNSIDHNDNQCPSASYGINVGEYNTTIVIDHNTVHDNGCLTPGSGFSDGLYVDSYTNGTSITNNVVYNQASGYNAEIYPNKGGALHNLTISNNTFGIANELKYSGRSGDILFGPTVGGTIYNNTFITPNNEAIRLGSISTAFSNVTISDNTVTGGAAITSTPVPSGVTATSNNP